MKIRLIAIIVTLNIMKTDNLILLLSLQFLLIFIPIFKLKREKANKKIIGVSTTSARTLEAFSTKAGQLKSGSKWVDIYIYPGYQYKFIDDLLTNFHLPKSSLLFMVSALASREFILKAYQKAVAKKYRFFSFGDAMLISKDRLK